MRPEHRVHFIGLGGIGMSGIARMYLALGHRVQGSDARHTPLLADLEKEGIRVLIGHDPAHLDGADLVVYSSSIQEDHPERLAATQAGIRVIHRADALAALCGEKWTVAVTGTHGKTTTTAMVGLILQVAGRDPSVVVGGLVDLLGGNARAGLGKEMVIEADESDASFLKFNPDMEVITNIEKEHLDHYGTAQKMEEAYRDFVLRLKAGGQWIGCAEDPGVRRLTNLGLAPAVLYGFEDSCDFYATDIVECFEGVRGVSFSAWKNGKLLGPVQMKVLGRHNVLNALGAIAASSLLSVDFSHAQKALSQYEGAGRRFDVKYESPGVMIVDDYAHHPTEIQKTLAAARSLAKKRIFAVFQPHRYTRTAFLMEDFAVCFGDADKLFITDIYAASEKPIENISAEKVCEAVQKAGHPDANYVPRRELAAAVESQINAGDLVIALGAGDVYQVAGELSLFREVRGKVLFEEPLSKHTTLKIGGPAEFWIEPEDVEDLKTVLWECRKRGLRVRIFGAGSNLLVADEGVRGVVLYLGAPYFREIISSGGNQITARAGVMNTLFIQEALERGLGGFEFLSGIPGNIGGAVAMNAGSHGQSVDQFLEEVLLLNFQGHVRRVPKKDIPFSYRSSGIQNEMVIEALFSFPKTDRKKTKDKLDEYREYRANTQDLRHASAGCLFKNPTTGGVSSGQLIEEAGLKGFAVGNAGVSEKHANFMINRGGATAGEVQELILKVREAVKQKSGITLETEVKFISDDGEPRGRAEKIAVLAGGLSCEREVSLVSGKAVFQALKAKGYDAVLVDPVGDFVPFLKSQNVTMVFNAVHGTFGEDGTLQKILENADLPYTGSGVRVSEFAFDKAKAQEIFKKEGILVPEFQVLRSPDEIAELVLDRFPVVVKPSKSGSSVGISIVQKKEELEEACRKAFAYSDTVLVEEYIRGRELTVGFLGDEPLPIVEVIPEEKFYDYKAKYQSSGTRYEFPAHLTAEEEVAVSAAAVRAYRALGCRVMGRVDILLSEGSPYVLEINTIPGLTGKSLLPKAAKAAGVTFEDLCVKIIDLSKVSIQTGY